MDSGYVHGADQLDLIRGAAAALRACRHAGYLVFVVTNQSGVARGFFNEGAVNAFNDHLRAALATEGAVIDDVRYCPHHEHAVLPEYRRVCDWRKPGPGMILDLARTWEVDLTRSFLIGDQGSDMAAAAAAGIAGYLFGGDDLDRFVQPILTELAGVGRG